MSGLSTPPPPAGSNTGVYAGVAVLLLAGIGFFVWKSCEQPAQTKTTVEVPPAPTSTGLKIEDIPLPPPIEDSGPPDTGSTVTKVTGPGPDPCSQKTCNGTATDELATTLQARANTAKVRQCYDRALEADNTLQGKVHLLVKVGRDGTICGANVLDSDLANPAVANCAAGAVRNSPAVPAPKGGCVEIKLPINFKPGGR